MRSGLCPPLEVVPQVCGKFPALDNLKCQARWTEFDMALVTLRLEAEMLGTPANPNLSV
jgi:hypothetical protein